MDSLSAFIERVSEVCPLPATARRILELCQSERVMIPDLAKVITTDPALAAAVLRIANSAAYGGRGIDQLDVALMRIGLRELRDMAAAMSLLATFRSQAELSLKLHDRSVVSGAIGSLIAKSTGACAPGTAFTGGLLCEIGAMACLAADGKPYLRIWKDSGGHEETRIAIELEHYGFTSLQVGACFLQRNGLPDTVSQAVGTSLEAAATAPDPLAKVIVLARLSTSRLVGRPATARHTELRSDLYELASSVDLEGVDGQRLLEVCIEAGALAQQALKAAR